MPAMNWYCFELWRIILACISFIASGVFFGCGSAGDDRLINLRFGMALVLICVGVLLLLLTTSAGGG